MKLFRKNSNLCDHNPPTSQTDGRTDRQTDRQTTCDRNTALCTKVHRAVKTKQCKQLSFALNYNAASRGFLAIAWLPCKINCVMILQWSHRVVSANCSYRTLCCVKKGASSATVTIEHYKQSKCDLSNDVISNDLEWFLNPGSKVTVIF